MRSLLAAVAAVGLLISPAQAAGSDTIQRMTPEQLVAILADVTGKKPEIGKNDAGDPVVSLNTGNGYDDYVLGRCTQQGCLDIQATTFFEKDPKLTLAVVNAYNNKYLNAQGSIAADGRVYLVRLFVVDGGVGKENIEVNIKIFMQSPDLLMEVLSTQATASLPSNGVPVAAVRPGLMQRQPVLASPINTDPRRARRVR